LRGATIGTPIGGSGVAGRRVGGSGSVKVLGDADKSGEVAGGGIINIGGENHSGSTVVGLPTVSPDGVRAVDGDLKHGKLSLGSTSSNELEARVETNLTSLRSSGKHVARLSKTGLGDSVVLGIEDELDFVTGLDLQGGRIVTQSIGTNFDNVGLADKRYGSSVRGVGV